MSISITYTIEREVDGEIVETQIEATGDFYRGELEDYSVTPSVKLTEREECAIEEKLCDARADDWDEDSWQANREAA